MNKRLFITLTGLLIISGVLFFLSSKDNHIEVEERSDVVITIEKTPPVEEPNNQTNPDSPKSESNIDPEIIDFSEEAQKTLTTLPRIDELQALSEEEVHHTPKILRESGEKVASMIEKAEKTPKLRQETMKMLKSCAESADAAPSIRALCWNKLLKNIPRWKIFVPLMDADVPQDIKDLASRL